MELRVINPEHELYAKVLRVIVWEQYGILLPKDALMRVLQADNRDTMVTT